LDLKHLEHWSGSPGQRHAKLFISPMGRSVEELLALSRKDLRMLAGLLIGHCPLRYNLCLIRKINKDICRLCDGAVETSEHLLCECAALGRQRFRHLGNDKLDPSEIAGMATGRLLHFISDRGRRVFAPF